MCLSLLFFSCKKKHTLKVTVTNVGTGQPMANNKVYIRELTNKVGSMGGGTVTHPFYTGTTDQNGELYITKKFDTRYTYEVSVDLPENWAYVENISYTMVPKGQYWNNIDFKIANAAYLKLSIHNVNCQGAGDTMILYEKNINVPDFYLQKGWPFYGCENFSNDYDKVAMGSIEMKWVVKRNNTNTIYYDTIYLAEGEYKTYTINYWNIPKSFNLLSYESNYSINSY